MLPIVERNIFSMFLFYFIRIRGQTYRVFFLFVTKRIIFGNFFLCFFVFLASSLFFFQAIFSRERKWIISISTELRIKKLRPNIWIINYPKKQLVEIITLFLTFFRLLKANHFLIIFELSCFSLYPCFLQAIFSVESGLLVYRRTKFGD